MINYEIVRFLGKVQCVKSSGEGQEKFIPLVTDNSDFQAFLAWNAEQPTPLDLSDREPEPLPLDERRKAEYVKRGITTDALIVALWEKVVERRDEPVDQLQAIRQQVKTSIPKEL